jgi:hypothetical protein
MFAPCRANASAMPSPIPLVEPVTKAVLFFSMSSPSAVLLDCTVANFGK